MIDHYQQSIFDGTEQSMYNKSIELIKTFEEVALQRNPVGYVVGYSGGKDSDVLVDLFRKSGVKFMVRHNHTTLDAPETVYYVRRKFAEWKAQGIPCKIYYPEMSFWSLCLKKKMLPLMIARFRQERRGPPNRYLLYEKLLYSKSFGILERQLSLELYPK